MFDVCWTVVGPILDLCWTYVGPMLWPMMDLTNVLQWIYDVRSNGWGKKMRPTDQLRSVNRRPICLTFHRFQQIVASVVIFFLCSKSLCFNEFAIFRILGLCGSLRSKTRKFLWLPQPSKKRYFPYFRPISANFNRFRPKIIKLVEQIIKFGRNLFLKLLDGPRNFLDFLGISPMSSDSFFNLGAAALPPSTVKLRAAVSFQKYAPTTAFTELHWGRTTVFSLLVESRGVFRIRFEVVAWPGGPPRQQTCVFWCLV